MSEMATAWKLFDQVLRTFFLSLWRLAPLVLATAVVYTTFWWLVLRDRPYASGFDQIDPIERLITIAVIFPPLAVAVMRRAIIGKTWLRDLWQSSVWLVAGLIFLALIALHLVNGYIVDPLIYASMTGDSGWVSKAVWRLQTWGSVALFVAVGARLVWGVPALAVGRAKSLKVAFLKMRGNYRLALLVCLLTVMPLYIFNYHFGIWPNTGMSLGALLFESELQAWLWFLKDGAAIACRSILLSALAAVIYRAEFGSRGATAP